LWIKDRGGVNLSCHIWFDERLLIGAEDILITGLILSGGRSRRFGSDKAQAVLAGQTLAERVVVRARHQVDQLIISTNELSPPAVFEAYPRLADVIGGSRGPLAGILTGLQWVESNQQDCREIITFSVDSPFFPEDLVVRLLDVNRKRDVPVIASSGGRSHPVFGLWPVSLCQSLRKFMQENERGSAMEFFRMSGGCEIAFSDMSYDPFFNINDQNDMAQAHKIFNRLMPTSRDVSNED
jgi:molybdopterin-guanine dinucleotide biosynthesis protein A